MNKLYFTRVVEKRERQTDRQTQTQTQRQRETKNKYFKHGGGVG